MVTVCSVYTTLRSPPFRCTVTAWFWGQRPVCTAAATAAHAPVPQAIVSPLPRSIYEIEGAERCAIEFCSFSKTAGFTGTRCGYTVVPMALERQGAKLNRMWLRRQTTKFNGVPYIVQKGAAAVFTEEGQRQARRTIDYYKENARVMAGALQALGVWFVGGKNSPYLWMKCPNGMDSWSFFDALLAEAQVVGTPGVGFGHNGEGYFRLTAFGDQAKTKEAMQRMTAFYKRL